MIKPFFALILSLTCCFSAIGQTKNFIDQPYIEVSGYYDTLVTPNLIYIKIVISEKDSRDKISIEEQETKMVAALKSLGINTEIDLTTRDILSNFKHYLFKRKDILKTKEYILKVTSAETVSKVFVLLEDLDISNASIHGLYYSEMENLRYYCRTRAIESSHKKAIAITKPIGQTIGNAIHIVETHTDLDKIQGHSVGAQDLDYIRSYDKGKYEATKIEFEKIKVSSTIRVVYILK